MATSNDWFAAPALYKTWCQLCTEHITIYKNRF